MHVDSIRVKHIVREPNFGYKDVKRVIVGILGAFSIFLKYVICM